MPLFPLSPIETDDPQVKEVFERQRQRWGSVLNLYRVLAWSPTLVKSWAPFAWALRFDLAASRKLRELLIIRIATLLGADYEYVHHLKMAQEAGVTDDQVDALDAWRESPLFDDQEEVVLQLADELALSKGASPDTMKRLQAFLSHQDVVELVVTGAFYCGVARVINSFDIQLEDNHEGLRPRRDS